MKIFISGATGYIGSRIALRLAGQGHQIHALYREMSKAAIINHPNIRLFQGDILDPESLKRAIEDCEEIYHTAAFARIFHKQVYMIYRLNIEGTANVLEAGIAAGVKRMVCTSTGGVLGPSFNGKANDETTSYPESFFIDYECSKALMEKMLLAHSQSPTEIVVVNPTRVYGPGVLSESNGVTRLILKYISGKWRIIPGNGTSIGNYVFIEDVVTGHLLAMEKGRAGERYILGGENLSYDEFFAQIAVVSGRKYATVHMPVNMMVAAAHLMSGMAILAGSTPLITPSLASKYSYNWAVSSEKSRTELGYQPISFNKGVELTIKWIQTPGL